MTKPNRSPKPSEDRFPPTYTFHEKPVRWLFWHWWYCRRLKTRGKLRCPACGVYGTWKPYGLFSWQDRLVRRWLCKWCGFYDGTDGRFWAYMDSNVGTWVLAPQPGDISHREFLKRMDHGEVTTPRRLAAGPGEFKQDPYPKSYSPFVG